MKVLTFLLFCVVLSAFSEELVLWEYDLHTLPPGWDFDYEWEFGPDGAEIDITIGGFSGSLFGTFGSLDTCAVLPDGTEWITFYADQGLSLWGNGGCVSWARVSISWDAGANWSTIWEKYSGYSTYDPLMLTVSDVAGGDSLQVRFNAYAMGSNYGGSSAHWTLENFVLTAHGEVLSFDQTSWGAIKALSCP